MSRASHPSVTGWDFLELVVRKKKDYRECTENFGLRVRDHLRKLISKQVCVCVLSKVTLFRYTPVPGQAATRNQSVRINSISIPEHKNRHNEVRRAGASYSCTPS